VTGSLGKRYARGLLGLTRAGSVDAAGADLARAAAAFEEPRLRAVIMSPAIQSGVRRQVVKEVVAALGPVPVVGNLVNLLADRDRLPLLSDVARWYDTLVDQAMGRARVQIRTAAPLSASEKSEVLELARRLTGRREVIATTDVDPELLGGVVLDAEGTVYDGSIRTQLARLSKEMAEGGA
jgi:F-type H+-transporting ATPase subunit delta